MRKTKGTVVALSTVAALLATGGVAAAVATTGGDASPVSADTTQTQAQSESQKQTDGDARAKSRPEAKHAPKGDGSKRLCKRAPKIDKRIDRLQRRLDGGVRTRGSFERLEKRIENAKKEGHDVIADFLNDRLDDRRELKTRLGDREDGLKKVRAWCATQDFDKGDKSDKNSTEG
ncbi:hypothetical protein [Streptomyces winkii]|uniref:hypothetical protein n=1 Tax=Streptomyces winkii TaxID=3051178 RepID=UPI0028D64CAD|nr:hypothetical protein [Streptomyces sp. DSM 40971]